MADIGHAVGIVKDPFCAVAPKLGRYERLARAAYVATGTCHDFDKVKVLTCLDALDNTPALPRPLTTAI